MPAQKSVKAVQPSPKSDKKAYSVPASKPPVTKSKAQQLKEAADALLNAGATVKKKPGRPPKAAAAAAAESDAPVKTGAKRGRKPKGAVESTGDDMDMSDIESDLVGEPEAVVTTPTGEKVKPLRMKISKAKERALMKEFGLDETVLSEEDIAKRRARLKALITLGKTRGYLTHGEISERHGRGGLRTNPRC
jgi:RNA polymerase primary sigma factor